MNFNTNTIYRVPVSGFLPYTGRRKPIPVWYPAVSITGFQETDIQARVGHGLLPVCGITVSITGFLETGTETGFHNIPGEYIVETDMETGNIYLKILHLSESASDADSERFIPQCSMETGNYGGLSNGK